MPRTASRSYGNDDTSHSICDEVAHGSLEHGLVPQALPPDDTRVFELATLPVTEVWEQVVASDIRDSMTVSAVLPAAR